MSVAARREGKSSLEIAKFYTDIFFRHCDLLNIARPDVVCKATDHIPQMISLIRRLEEKGLAYAAGGNVYFDVSRLPDYGKLAQLDLESLKVGARIEVDSNKRHPLDFALWFTKSKFENQELQWDSPWGRGYPGWHIECSAMSMNYLGETFDIHCGGIDHIPVHHTNEIAQSEGATGKPFARFWMHGGFLVADNSKMSKSAGGFLTLDRLTGAGTDPMSYRLLCLGSSYRMELAWSDAAIDGASNALQRLRSEVEDAHAAGGPAAEGVPLSPRGAELRGSFRDAIFHDLGMPKALAVFYSTAYDTQLSAAEKLSLLYEMDLVFGLGVLGWQAVEAPESVKQLAEARLKARAGKDWKEADRLRAEIAGRGFSVEDTREGYKLRRG
jgi:cysteinyl-tRNA synthetase